jgi:antirestriction protein ArdC
MMNSKPDFDGDRVSGQDIVSQVVTQRIIEALEKGTVPWERGYAFGLPPSNGHSRKPYQGFNNLVLSASDNSSPFWFTFLQAKQYGGFVKAGSRGVPIVFWKTFDRQGKPSGGEISEGNSQEGEESEAKQGRSPAIRRRPPLLRYSTVFSVDQIDGLKVPYDLHPQKLLPTTEFETPACLTAEAVMKLGTFCPISNVNMPQYFPGLFGERHETAPAYSVRSDAIRLPLRESYQSPHLYYSTGFHEMVHSTGIAGRLARTSLTNYHDDEKAKAQEELVAEIGASFLCARCGIVSDKLNNQEAAYIACYLKRFKSDPKMVIYAAQQASKAVNFIIEHALTVGLSKATEVEREQLSRLILPSDQHSAAFKPPSAAEMKDAGNFDEYEPTNSLTPQMEN